MWGIVIRRKKKHARYLFEKVFTIVFRKLTTTGWSVTQTEVLKDQKDFLSTKTLNTVCAKFRKEIYLLINMTFIYRAANQS